MKKALSFILLLCAITVFAFAQKPGRGHHEGHQEPPMPRLEEMIDDLSAMQKHKLNKVTEASKKRVDKLIAEQKQVRAQILKLIDLDGDYSKELFPLYDRENQLQAEVSKEMYRCKTSIDKILTDKQLAKFKKELAAERKKHHKQHKEGAGRHASQGNEGGMAK